MPRHALRPSLALAAALTVPALVMAAQLYAGYRLSGIPVPFAAVLVVQLCHWELWVLAGPAVWHLAQQWPMAPSAWRGSLLRHVAAAPVIAAAVLAAFLALYHAIIRVPILSEWFVRLDHSLAATSIFFAAAYFHVELLIYAAIVAAAHASRNAALLRAKEHDALRLEAALTGARLTALRTQLQPHFLFNALHTVGSLILQRRNEPAVELLAELGELLRETLAHRETDLAPLREEIAYLGRYLKIEEARFGDRVKVQWHVDAAALEALVPPFILQPLVENAFRHGISRRVDDSIVSISAVLDGGSLRVHVYNDGPGLPEPFVPGEARGFGLKNVVQRLRTREPGGRLELANATRPDRSGVAGVRATLVLPLWEASAT